MRHIRRLETLFIGFSLMWTVSMLTILSTWNQAAFCVHRPLFFILCFERPETRLIHV